MIPELSTAIKDNHGYDLFPYVDLKGKTPSEGIVSFNDLPRYSMGYTSLFNTISFTVETHIRHVTEIKEGMTITAKTQVLEGEGKKLRLFQKYQ